MLNKKKLLIAALALMLVGSSVPVVKAGSTSAILYTDEKSKFTPVLGNTTGAYKMVGAVSSSSKYSVEYYFLIGKDGSQCNIDYNHFSYTDMSAFKKYYCNFNKSTYTVARSVMYGNKKSNPKKQCYANVILSNY